MVFYFFDFYKEHSLNIFSRAYRQSIKAHLSKHKKTRVEIILALLIESGFIYCGLWVITTSFKYNFIILTTYFERLCLLPLILMLLTITILLWLVVCILQWVNHINSLSMVLKKNQGIYPTSIVILVTIDSTMVEMSRIPTPVAQDLAEGTPGSDTTQIMHDM